MLPKSERFTKQDFVGKRPKVFFRGELFDVAALILTSQKFACVLSKKTVKNAVDRNYIKRRIFGSLTEIQITSSDSFIFYPKKGCMTAPQAHIRMEINKAFATLEQIGTRK